MAPARPVGPSLGWQIVSWMETFLCHGPGDLRGEKLELDDERRAFLVRCYEIGLGSGRRKVNEAVLSRLKGWAKSELAGGMVCGELLGPVRFDHWAKRGETTWWGYQFEKGEPVGRPVRDPFIRCLATEEGQAGNTYDNVEVMLEHLERSHGGEFPKLDIGKTRTFIVGGGEVRPSTASSAAKDGGKETFAVFDETHLYVLPELREMYRTVSQNLTKRPRAEPWKLQTSTMFQPGKESTAEQTMRGEGKTRGLLVDHREGPMPEDWDDDDELLACVSFAAGQAASWMDLDHILTEIRDPQQTKPRSSRYYLNRAEVEADQAVDPRQWKALERLGPVPPPGTFVSLGFDGSDSQDSTGLVGEDMVTGRQFEVAIWERPRDVRDWKVPRGLVDETVAEVFDRLRVVRMLCDPRGWRSEISEWQARYGDEVVLEFPTNSWLRMARAVDRWLVSIREGSFTHDGSAALGRHVANARLLEVNPARPESGVVLVKESSKSPLKIDGAVCSVLAHEGRDEVLASGWTPPRDDSVYEERGLVTL